MDKKFLWSNAAFYVSLAVCLVAVAAGSWFLLFGRDADTEPADAVFQPAAEVPAAPVSTPEGDKLPLPATEVIETLLPQEISMPEEPVSEPSVFEEPAPVFDPAPIEAQPPQPIVEPLVGEVVAAFSVSELQYDPTFQDWRIHDGVDIAAAAGTAVLSASGGTVDTVCEDPLMGVTVVIDHGDGYRTTYANLAENPPVTVGEAVCAGAVIGAVGSTALAESARECHLHFSVSHEGDVVDPYDYLHR